jgi:hypothetical protein
MVEQMEAALALPPEAAAIFAKHSEKLRQQWNEAKSPAKPSPTAAADNPALRL